MLPSRARGVATKSMLAVLAALVLLGVALLVGYLRQTPTKPAADVGRKVAEAFLALLHDNHVGEAWDGTTVEFKSIEGRESFIRTAAKAPLLKEHLQFVSMQEVHVNDQPRAEYIFQSPESKMVRVLIGYENSQWKVDRLTL